MDHFTIYASDGASGGLLLFWSSPVVIQAMDIQANFIDVAVCNTHQNPWRLTCFYGEPKWEDRHLSWGYLRNLKQQTDLPWIVIGDFNEILYSHEKEGGAPRPLRMMQAFRDSLSECGLEDMGYEGDQFTWRRRRVRERLDRAVCNGGFHEYFPRAKVINTGHDKSDHRPLLLDTEGEEEIVFRRTSRTKAFELAAGK